MKSLLSIALLCSLSVPAWANEAQLEKIDVATDKATIERGAGILMDTCHSCHSMKYLKYRNLLQFGIDKQKVDGWRGDQPLDAPVLSQMSDSDNMASFGKLPPDLSLMAKARDGGPNYLYSYLLAYYTTPDGTLSNHVFPETKMPDILNISSASDETQRKEIRTQAHEVVSFLTWVADPHATERMHLGYYVLAYLAVLTTLLYFVKDRIWSRLK